MSFALLIKLLGFAKQYWKQIVLVVLALVIFIMMLPILLIATITPSADDSFVDTHYKKIAEDANLDWGELLIYDVVINDNDLTNVNTNDTAYKFLIVDYEKYEKQKVCIEKDKNGKCTKWDYEWVLADSGVYEGKKQITGLMKKLGYNFHNWPVGEVVKTLNDLNNNPKYNISISRKDLDDLIAPLDKEKQEWAKSLLADNAIYEIFGELIDLPDYIEVKSSGFFAWPTPDLKRVSSPYGWRYHPTEKQNLFHYGVDITGSNAYGKPIIAVADGEIFQVNYGGGNAGYNIRIKHYDNEGNIWHSRYCHMSTIKVSIGDKVKQGDVLGAVGNTGRSTGPHLHFELKYNNQLVNPLNYIK